MVRLFARLKEIAGSPRIEVEGSTVGEVVAAANERLGAEFQATARTARIWRNGEEADLTDAVGPEDEVAILPPVSGGAMTSAVPTEVGLLYPIVVLVALVIANLMGGPAAWAAVVVGVLGLWTLDLSGLMDVRARPFPAVGILLGIVAGAIFAHVVGPVGMAVGLAGATISVLVISVGVSNLRSVDAVAPGVLLGLLAAAAAGSLVLAFGPDSPDAQAIDVFLVVVIVATVAGLIVESLADLPYLDPYTVTAIAAVLSAVIAAVLWDLDVAGYLLVGLGLAVTLVAGRGLGSMVRTGIVSLVDRPPGLLPTLDGAVLAAAVYYPLIRLVL